MFGGSNVDQREIGMESSLEWAEMIGIADVGWEVKTLKRKLRCSKKNETLVLGLGGLVDRKR